MSQSDEADHCPFLNRADTRCSCNFNIDHLQHAYKHCFDRYKACGTYRELLIERRVRRVMGSVMHPPGEAVEVGHGNPNSTRFVQLRIQTTRADRYAQSAA